MTGYVPPLHIALSTAREGLAQADAVDIHSHNKVVESHAYLRGAMRYLLAALAPASRCAAAHPEDPTPCGAGPRDAVRVLDEQGAEVVGCVHHAARLYASMERPRVYPMPGHDQAAIEVYQLAQTLRPFCWLPGGGV